MLMLRLWWAMFTDMPSGDWEFKAMRGFAVLCLPLFLGLAPFVFALELIGWAAGVATRRALRLYEWLTVGR